MVTNVEYIKMAELEPYPIDLTPVAQAQSCEEITHTLVHELSQPLTTMSIYIWGCIYKLMNGTQDSESILHVMNKAMQDIEHAQEILLHIKDCIHNDQHINHSL